MNWYEGKHIQRVKGDFLRGLLSRLPKGRALVFEGAEPGSVGSIVATESWSGLYVTPGERVIHRDPLESIVGRVGSDSRFTALLDGYWVRQFTVAEIFVQFGGEPFDLIACVGTGRDRELWYTQQIQAALPKVYVIEEDGHNEEVIQRACERGYRSFLSDNLLVMVHE